jgi:hypothetical protein
MSGTPSRTATAWSRGRVERKLEAKPRPEEDEVHTRRRHGGQGAVGIRSPMTSGPGGVDATGTRRRSRVLPWETCPFAQGKETNVAVKGAPLSNAQAHSGRTPRMGSEQVVQRPLDESYDGCKAAGRRGRSQQRPSEPRAGGKGPNMMRIVARNIRGTRRCSPRVAEPERIREASGGTTHGSITRIKRARHATRTPGTKR